MCRKNIQDQGRPVDDLGLGQFREVSHLRSSELIITDDAVGVMDLEQLFQLCCFSLADVCRSVRMSQILDGLADSDPACGVQKICKLIKRVPGSFLISRCHGDKNVFFI